MSQGMQHARISGPIQYGSDRPLQELPRGPCLLERIDDGHVDIFWGDRAEHSAQVLASEVKRAADDGDLVLLN